MVWPFGWLVSVLLKKQIGVTFCVVICLPPNSIPSQASGDRMNERTNERTTFQHIYSDGTFHKKLTSFIMGKPRNFKEEKANPDSDDIVYPKSVSQSASQAVRQSVEYWR